MTNLTLDRPAVLRTSSRRQTRTLPAAVGSYVDTDGVRHLPVRTRSYTGTPALLGSYTGRPSAFGSYVRSQG